MDRATFERRLAELTRAHESSRDNVGCIQCQGCERCIECTFCVGCKSSRRCRYCTKCESCTGCTQCSGCAECTDCQHCVDARKCLRGAYLVQCAGCSDCTYCFGCVGLVGKDFHILNEPYDRSAYFALVEKLSASATTSSTRTSARASG
jgi:hypothetical protein